MGEAKRKQHAMANGDFWQFTTADGDSVKELSLDGALNLLGYYSTDQAKKAMPNMVSLDIAQIKINDRIYQSVKKHCLKTGLLWNVRTGESVSYSPKTWKQIAYWGKKNLSTKKA